MSSSPVNFDDQARCAGVEISDVGADGVLTAEFDAERQATKLLSQLAFWLRHFTAQLASALKVAWVDIVPSTVLAEGLHAPLAQNAMFWR